MSTWFLMIASSSLMRASFMPCSFLAAWYSKFSDRSPSSRAALILAAICGRQTRVSSSCSLRTASRPSGVMWTSSAMESSLLSLVWGPHEITAQPLISWGLSYTFPAMRRLLLTIAMLLMGMALVGGAAAALVPTSLLPLDQEVGTHTSAAGAVLGIGLMAAAFNPSANVAWVRAGILYGFVVLGFEAGAYFLWREPFHIGPVFFGLAFTLLLIALYPQRRKLVPSKADDRAAAPAPIQPALDERDEKAESKEEKKAPDSEAAAKQS